MTTLFNSILVNKLIFDNHSDDVMLECTVYEEAGPYDSTFFLSSRELNVLLCELSARNIEIDFEQHMKQIDLSNGETIHHLEVGDACAQEVFLPAYIFGNQQRALRA